MIERIKQGMTTANFFEGMGCRGGCVGGPKRMITVEEGERNVDNYSDRAEYKTPLENPFVLELLTRLGFHTVEEFLEKSDLLVRDFS